jgi:Fanconi anemia group M protein
MTASPGSEAQKVREICKHLNIQAIESRSRDSPDVKPYLQKLDFEKIEVPFPKEFIEIKILLKNIYEKKINELKQRNLLFAPANKITLLQLQSKLAIQASQRDWNAMLGMSLTAQAIKLSHAIELLETQTLAGLNSYLKGLQHQAEQKQSKGVQKLVNEPEFKATLLSLNSLLSQKIEHPKIEELAVLIENELKNNLNAKIIIFTQFRDTASIILHRLKQLPNAKPSLFIGQAKKLNHKNESIGMNQKEQKQIINDFKENIINTLIATSIGEEGLDIPEVNAVIFYEPIPSAIRKIQRAGRTARLSPGKLIILMTKDTRDIAFHYASHAREKKMYKTLDLIKEELKNNKNKNIQPPRLI